MWKRGEIQFPEEALVCYTDGSRLASGQASGAGICGKSRSSRELLSSVKCPVFSPGRQKTWVKTRNADSRTRSRIGKLNNYNNFRNAAICEFLVSQSLIMRKCREVLHNVIKTKLKLTSITPEDIEMAYRCGSKKEGPPRAILNEVYFNKKNLKGSGITIREDLTATRMKIVKEKNVYIWE
nr:unnamed protein product [Callosobruchus chinensis]